jgi:hypothetical protein
MAFGLNKNAALKEERKSVDPGQALPLNREYPFQFLGFPVSYFSAELSLPDEPQQD